MLTPAPKPKFSFNKRFQSFSFAFHGLKYLWRDEHNARVHVFVALVVILFGCFFNVSKMEWCVLILSITLVISAECFNSALEGLCDLVSQDYHPIIKKVKDLSAAAVLICASGASIAGLLVFIPYIFY